MRLSEIIDESLVRLNFTAADKWEAIARAVDVLVEEGRVAPHERQAVLDVVIEREKSVTTGMERGIAIPHANSTVVADVMGVFAISPGGIPFESLDGQPANLIILLLIPKAKFLQHVRTLANIARLLNHADVVAAFQDCTTPAEVMALIEREEAREI